MRSRTARNWPITRGSAWVMLRSTLLKGIVVAAAMKVSKDASWYGPLKKLRLALIGGPSCMMAVPAAGAAAIRDAVFERAVPAMSMPISFWVLSEVVSKAAIGWPALESVGAAAMVAPASWYRTTCVLMKACCPVRMSVLAGVSVVGVFRASLS